MKTEIVSQDSNIVTTKAQYTPEEVAQAVEKTYKKISKNANLKGFRKGHIPRKTLELYFPKSSVYAETLEDLIPDAIDKMIEEYELKLIKEPELTPGELKEGEPYEFTVKFEVTPDFDLPDLSTIEIEKVIFDTTDEMVEEQLQHIISSSTKLVPSYEDRPVTKEDNVSLKYDTIVVHGDGTETKEQDGQKTEIFLGADTIRPEVAEAIIGKVPGDTVTIELPLEGEEAKKDNATATRYEIELLGIMKEEKPELTDEFVKELTKGRQNTVDELKAELRKQLEAGEERRANEAVLDKAANAVADMVQFEIPKSLIEKQKEAIKKQQADRIQRENKMTLEEFLEANKMDKEGYEKEVDDAATKIVKRALVLDAIADANDIEWTPEELTKEISNIARMSGVDAKKLQDYVYSDKERLFDMAEKIRSRKTVDFVAKNVKINEVHKQEEAEAAK